VKTIGEIKMLVCICLFVFSCSDNQSKHPEVVATVQQQHIQKKYEFKKGSVVDNVPIRGQVGQSYALYLPDNYSEKKASPLMIVLDPHARGAFPLEKYKSLANEFDIIMAGSNYSKNGVVFKNILSHIQFLMQDIIGRFAIDSSKIWCLGFSGGARIALSIGVLNYGLDAVIACGAGVPVQDTAEIHDLSFIGLVGDADMNYPELFNLNRALRSQHVDNTLLVFNGIHEWPPDSIMYDAFVWLQLNYYNHHGLKPSDSFLKNKINRDVARCNRLENPYVKSRFYEKMISFYSDFTNTSEWTKELKRLNHNPKTIQTRDEIINILQTELMNEQKMSEAFVNADLKWWQKEINRIRDQSKSNPDEQQSKSAQRMLAYIGLAAYSYSNRAINSGPIQTALKYINIYKYIEPDNPEHAYLMAILLVKEGKMAEAIVSLQNAAQLGFSDSQRLLNDPALSPLQQNPGFNDLIIQIEANNKS